LSGFDFIADTESPQSSRIAGFFLSGWRHFSDLGTALVSAHVQDGEGKDFDVLS